MREVAIVGAGMTRFGELWESGLRDLFAEAALEALKSAGADHLDGIYVGAMSGGRFVGQEHLGPLMASQIGMAGVPATRVESACASGGAALRCAWLEVASGQSDLVMAAGVEKMTDGADVTQVLATAAKNKTIGGFFVLKILIAEQISGHILRQRIWKLAGPGPDDVQI